MAVDIGKNERNHFGSEPDVGRPSRLPLCYDCSMPTDPERRRQLRTKALEHLEAARACLDESGDRVGNYLVERAIDEVTSQQWPALDPFSADWPTKPSRKQP